MARFGTSSIHILVACFAIVGALGSPGLGQFDSDNVTLLSHLPLSTIGGSFDSDGGLVFGNDIWGWQDSLTGKEYALMGRTDGTAFVDVTDGANPIFLGNLPTETVSSTWRDIKVYNDRAYIVADRVGPHGIQIFDLTNLRNVTSPQTFSAPTSTRGNLRDAHNIAINEDSGFAYIVDSDLAAGGLHIVNLNDNINNPRIAGGFADDGSTHDVQVVNYTGPDPDYAGREIAFASNGDTVTLVDVTNKSNPSQISRNGYPGSVFAHQGWLTEDHRYFLFNDELDECNLPLLQNGFGCQPDRAPRTHIMDVSDLDNPVYVGFHEHDEVGIDHNLYVQGNYVYAANYTAGVRILELTDLANAELTEVGFIDTSPNTSPGFRGAWSVYPFFDDGKIIISDLENGLFVAQVDFLANQVDIDFDDDGVVDCNDIDALTAAISGGANNTDFDLTGDGIVDLADQQQWLTDAGAQNLASGNPYLDGDANLDGVVDGSDFNIWNQNKFTATSAWCSADFTADGVVDGSDFNIWNQNKFSSSADVAPVPEPSAVSLLVLSILGLVAVRRGQF